jgi:hypothetical protein
MRIVRMIATPVLLLALLGFLTWGAWWGYRNVMAPVPAHLPDPCVTQSVGQTLQASKVTVSVYNGGYVAGQANTVAKALKAKGFIIKHVDNTDQRIKQTVIVGAAATNPEVKLVAGHFKGATVKADNRPDHTVDVMIGTAYAGMNGKAATSIAVPGGAVCLPTSATPTPSGSGSGTPAPSVTPKR